jgi:hypothetical protein
MRSRAHFDFGASRGYYRPVGSVSTGELADLVTATVRFSREQNLDALVINIAALTGFDSPGPAYRRWVVQRWAAAAGKQLRVAMVARREHICPAKTGLLVAAEEAFNANIFTSEAAAKAWLDNSAHTSPRTRRVPHLRPYSRPHSA